MKLLYIYLILFVTLVFISCSKPSVEEIRLEGEWRVVLDSLNVGIEEGWAEQDLEGATIQLPGTLDDAGIGEENIQVPVMDNSVMWG